MDSDCNRSDDLPNGDVGHQGEPAAYDNDVDLTKEGDDSCNKDSNVSSESDPLVGEHTSDGFSSDCNTPLHENHSVPNYEPQFVSIQIEQLSPVGEQLFTSAKSLSDDSGSDSEGSLTPNVTPLPLKKHMLAQLSAGAFDFQSYCSSSASIPLPIRDFISSELIGNPELHSCLTSANVTPVPGKKYWSTASDTGTDLWPLCRICQSPSDTDDIMFSPCRCSGSLHFVHYTCLLKWIEICSRKSKKTPRCELCHFQYVRHKRFKFSRWHLPRVSQRDKCLHVTFFLSVLVMVACAIVTVLCFLSDEAQINNNTAKTKVDLSPEEIMTLTCGVLFFVSFFIAMTVEIKAKHTIYKLMIKFITQNTEWQIEPYDKTKDPLYTNAPRLV